MKKTLLFFLVMTTTFAHAQTNVRAWYADGQVWVVWQAQQPFPETYAIYKSNQPFSNTNQADVIGRPFAFEYLPGTFVLQTGNPNFKYKIPKPDGSIYTLAPGEGLFVETVMASGSAFYAVVEWGQNAVAAGVNITDAAIAYNYDPVNEPVICHLQMISTLSSDHKANWYSLWLLGRQNENAGRPDFPVMANAFKNGMPSMFIVSEAIGMDTSGGKRIPATHCLHGGGGTAIQLTADKFQHINIAPQEGISVAQNDDFPHLLIADGDTIFSSARTLWFGWTKAHNPFNPGFDAGPGDTVINYTQRRILWISSWLVKHYRVDPDRIALQGYSMGSGGVSALGKAYPNLFSTICAFNNGFRGALEPTSESILGTVAENLPTNLRRDNNEVVRINEVFDMTTPLSPQRDFPLFRTWGGKNDANDRMHWGTDLVAQYRKADSLGWGMQISWDERPHTYDTLGFHWIDDIPSANQTFQDNLAYQERFNSKQSYPAFFNHRLDPQNNDPGTGLIGINNGDGDNWGTWGGYHRWDLDNITDLPAGWSATAWLESNAIFANDNCPNNSLSADVAIRKPQQFKPATGKTLNWNVKDLSNGNILQAGTTVVQADSLVVVPQVVVFKENIRRVRISVLDPTISAEEPESDFSEIQVFPNPTSDLIFFKKTFDHARVFDLNGKIVLEKKASGEAEMDVSALPGGFYFLEIFERNGGRQAGRFVKI